MTKIHFTRKQRTFKHLTVEKSPQSHKKVFFSPFQCYLLKNFNV